MLTIKPASFHVETMHKHPVSRKFNSIKLVRAMTLDLSGHFENIHGYVVLVRGVVFRWRLDWNSYDWWTHLSRVHLFDGCHEALRKKEARQPIWRPVGSMVGAKEIEIEEGGHSEISLCPNDQPRYLGPSVNHEDMKLILPKKSSVHEFSGLRHGYPALSHCKGTCCQHVRMYSDYTRPLPQPWMQRKTNNEHLLE